MSEEIKYYKNAAETHNARFAESSRDDYLSLTKLEKIIAYNNLESAPPLKCEKEIYLGFFFDGTNNNKYRDVKSNSQTNVKNSDF